VGRNGRGCNCNCALVVECKQQIKMYRFKLADSGMSIWAKLAKPSTRALSKQEILASRFHPAEFVNGAFVVDFADTFSPGTTAEIVTPLEFSPKPATIWAVGLNYKKHAEEAKMKVTADPTLFIKAGNSLNTPFGDVITPAVCNNELDYEGEIAIVIGKECKNVPPERAMDYILGFTVANDISARRWQGVKRGGGQWCRSKGFDTFLPLGPCITQPSDLPKDVQQLDITTTLKQQSTGETLVVQKSNTSDMIFSVQDIVSFVSQDTTLAPWTVIITGTPEGVGFARSPPIYMQPGDEVSVDIEGIGCIKQTIK